MINLISYLLSNSVHRQANTNTRCSKQLAKCQLLCI